MNQMYKNNHIYLFYFMGCFLLYYLIYIIGIHA